VRFVSNMQIFSLAAARLTSLRASKRLQSRPSPDSPRLLNVSVTKRVCHASIPARRSTPTNSVKNKLKKRRLTPDARELALQLQHAPTAWESGRWISTCRVTISHEHIAPIPSTAPRSKLNRCHGRSCGVARHDLVSTPFNLSRTRAAWRATTSSPRRSTSRAHVGARAAWLATTRVPTPFNSSRTRGADRGRSMPVHVGGARERRSSPPDAVVPPRWLRQRLGAPARTGRRPSTRAVLRRTSRGQP
jgi:hypothetical protein